MTKIFGPITNLFFFSIFLFLSPLQYCKSKVYTVNCGMAYGQAAMLLSLGAKGYRALQPNASSMLHFVFLY